MQSTILSCRNVGIAFDTYTVLKDVTFTVRKGEKVGLVGPNGSGKSSLLKIIAGILERDQGTVMLGKNTKLQYMPQLHEDADVLLGSGGEKAKFVLKKIIEENASVYLLDEPTNNIDVDGLEMLETFIKKSDAAFVIVSHDREFLDRTVTKIIEIDEVTKESEIYDGNYSAYAEEKKFRIDIEWKDYDAKLLKSKKLKGSMVQRLDWMRKIEQERFNIRKLDIHEKEKPVAAYLRDKEAKAGRRARVMKDRLARHEIDQSEIQKPKHNRPFRFMFEMIDRCGDKIFEMIDVKIQKGAVTLNALNVRVNYGDRIHVSGKNGAGKTTLIQSLIGGHPILRGSIKRADNLRIGYLSQLSELDLSKNVVEEFMRISGLDSDLARENLGKFKLKDDDTKKKVGELSPGERSRIILASLYAHKPHCIILDEPTNHLDFEALDTLESALKVYEGALVVISHDRYFVERVGFTKTFTVVHGEVIQK